MSLFTRIAEATVVNIGAGATSALLERGAKAVQKIYKNRTLRTPTTQEALKELKNK